MSESFVNPIFGAHEAPAPDLQGDGTGHDDTGHDGTGHDGVDTVVASLRGLDDLTVAEHVAVFEQAHESLRRTLAGAGQDSPAADRS